MYVSTGTQFEVYPLASSGTLGLPIRTFGNATGSVGKQMAFDSSGNLYTVTSDVLRFPAGASGATAPDLDIASPAGYPMESIAIDGSDYLYAAYGDPTDVLGNWKGSTLQVYAPHPTSASVPVATTHICLPWKRVVRLAVAANHLNALCNDNNATGVHLIVYPLYPTNPALYPGPIAASPAPAGEPGVLEVYDVYGDLTRMRDGIGLAVDRSANLFLFNDDFDGAAGYPNGVWGNVYRASAQNNAAPWYSLTFPASDQPALDENPVFDSSGNLLYGATSGRIGVFAPGAASPSGFVGFSSAHGSIGVAIGP
jgi:hypothetical protein